MHGAATLLAGWANFWVIVGSSAAALTGLQFVVIALAQNSGRARDTSALAAFATPTVVHLSSVLFVAAALAAPWHALAGAGAAAGLCGLAGVVYTLRVLRHARRQTVYEPVLEDWVFHFVLPLASYAGMLASALGLVGSAPSALFVVAGSALTLLLAAIHNAWDTATFLVERSHAERAAAEAQSPPSAGS